MQLKLCTEMPMERDNLRDTDLEGRIILIDSQNI